jgi:uncharacterized damage-inducible protein DinB
MLSDWLGRVILRDLESLVGQLNGYDDEKDIWRQVPGIANTTGTLALHLAGNLEHYIGAELGQSGYVRDRDAEFDTRDLPRAELLELVEKARTTVQAAIQEIGDESLEEEYPLEVGGSRLTTGLFLLHLAAHLAYHLGQIDYHRRVVTGGESLTGMQSIPALVGTSSDS